MNKLSQRLTEKNNVLEDIFSPYFSVSEHAYLTLATNPNLTLSFLKKVSFKFFAHKVNFIKKTFIKGENLLNFIKNKNFISLKDFWNYYSFNQNLKIDFLTQYINEDWNFRAISNASFISLNFILENLNKNWDWDRLSRNHFISVKDILKNRNLPWNWSMVSRNLSLESSDVESALEINWDWSGIAENENIGLELFEKNKHKHAVLENWYKLANNKNITLDFVKKYKDSFSSFAICRNSSLKIEQLFDIYELDEINLGGLSENLNINIETVLKYRELPWDWYVLSGNPSISILNILKYSYLNWNFSVVSERSDLTFELVKRFPQKMWDWDTLSMHHNITMKDITENRNLPWNFRYVSRNPNLTTETFKQNLNEKWCIENLFSNLFLFDTESISFKQKLKENKQKFFSILKKTGLFKDVEGLIAYYY